VQHNRKPGARRRTRCQSSAWRPSTLRRDRALPGAQSHLAKLGLSLNDGNLPVAGCATTSTRRSIAGGPRHYLAEISDTVRGYKSA
jgi:hypothetical protein